ncbi:MAG: hypothetical protein ACC707_21170, partial [Thiohalomonadales bacterium]
GLKLEWKKEVALKRKDSALNAQVVKAIFKTKHPLENKSVVKGLQLANGDYVIFSLTKVTEGNLADIDEAKKKTTKNRMTSVYGDSDFSQFVSDIKQSAKINIRKNNI